MKKTMRNWGHKIILIWMLAIGTLNSGCWDYREINDQMIVAGAAVDFNTASDEITLTAEMAVPTASEKGSAFNSKIYQGKGKNLLDAIVDLRAKAGHSLLWSHAKVLILNPELMEKEKVLVGIMDWIKRNHEMRETVWLLLSQEKTAGDILQQSNSQTEKIISQYLDNLFLAPEAETFPKVPYSEFVNDIQSQAGCAALPTVRLEKSGAEVLPFLDGTAIFKRTKPVCRLDGKQTRIYLLLRNDLNQAVLVPEGADRERLQAVSLKIANCSSSVEPVLFQKNLRMEIDIKMEADIAEIDSDHDVFKPDKINQLKAGVQSIIAARIKKLLMLLKECQQSDIFGLGSKVENKYPKLWRKIKNNWPQEYRKVPFAIHVRLNIPGSQQSMNVTKAGP